MGRRQVGIVGARGVMRDFVPGTATSSALSYFTFGARAGQREELQSP